MSHLQGKVAVVLGASAEGGMGWAIAEALAAGGAKVVVGARSEAPLKQLAQKIGGTAVVCDARKEEQVKALAQTAIERYGRLDIAVNSAGSPTLGLIADTTEQDLHTALQLNFLGNAFFVKHMAAAMDKDGSIVLISSISSTQVVIPTFAYACAKAATDCLVRYAALEYGPRGIRVNSVLPGVIITDMTKEFHEGPGVTKAFEKEIPLGRVGYATDIANTVLWLAGPAYVTGLHIPVCGGNQLTRFPYLSEFPTAEKAWEGKGVTLYDRENPTK